jgi:hypothetical protein
MADLRDYHANESEGQKIFGVKLGDELDILSKGDVGGVEQLVQDERHRNGRTNPSIKRMCKNISKTVRMDPNHLSIFPARASIRALSTRNLASNPVVLCRVILTCIV